MSMSISSTTATMTSGVASRPPISPERQAFRDLAKSLKAGDIDSAKQAYGSMIKNAPEGATWNPDSAFAQLGKALKSGDMTVAQEALVSMVRGRTDGPVSQPAPPIIPPSTGGLVDLVA